MHKRPRALERGQQGLHSPIILQPGVFAFVVKILDGLLSCAVSFTVVAIFAWLSARGNYPWISSLPPDEQSITIEFDKEEKEHTINAILPALGQSREHFLPFVDPLEPYYSTNPFRGNIARRSENFCSRLWNS